MPGRSRWESCVAWLLFAALARNVAHWAMHIIEESRYRHGYTAHRHPEIPWVYPTEDVATWVSAMIVELAITTWLLYRSTSVGITALKLGLGYGALLVVCAPMIMHNTWPYVGHVSSLLHAAGWCFAAGLVGVAVRWLHRRSRRDEAPAAKVVGATRRSAA